MSATYNYTQITNDTPVHHVVIDFVAIGSVVGALVGILPAIGGVLAVIWYGIQIYQFWRSVRRERRAVTAIPADYAEYEAWKRSHHKKKKRHGV